MIAFLDTSEKLDVCSAALGAKVLQLFTPLTNFNPQNESEQFAIDNGAFSRFNRAAFFNLLAKHANRRALCKFVAVPDVVGDARRTLECFDHFAPMLEKWPLALVIQDGQEHLPIPWDKIAAVFIGGTDEFKLGIHAKRIIKAAQVMDRWTHVGRVNTPGRWEMFEDLGVDSIDGSGLARFTHMREAIFRRRNESLFSIAGQV